MRVDPYDQSQRDLTEGKGTWGGNYKVRAGEYEN